ncbi:hypothetical protein LCGC14_2474320 [marine sediment metagenome]|uniref:Uncharacterized protein n=1 Tax=marine sediment metagenome TaxID=412755 RepID=A0A0F9E3A7_9ZZZZ
MERERVIEIFLGAIFIILLIIMIFSFTSVSASGSTTTTVTISDSYNTYNIETTQPRYVYDSYDYNKYPTRYYKTNKPYYNDERYLRYDYRPYRDYRYSRHNYKYTKGLFGNEINEYKVYLENKEHKSGYFTVKFYLADYEGKTRTESVTHYLKPYEGKIFRYKNVFDDEYDYAWNYAVKSPNY